MNPVEREENQSLRATENDQSTRPEVSKGTLVKQMCPDAPVDRSSDISEGTSAIKLKCGVSGGRASLKSQNPSSSNSEKHFFTFTFNERSRKSGHSVFTAHGRPNESIYSALRANDIFRERMKNPYNKDILVLEEKTVEGYINLGMPLKCLPTGSHLKISLGQIKKNTEEGQILRHCENPNKEIILFHVVAVGKTIKRIVKISELHEKGRTLCIYAMKGETVKEALCDDGRFRPDLDELEWKLIENYKNVHGKQSPVEEVSGKVLELDISKSSSPRKRTHKKTEQDSGNVTGEMGPQDPISDPSQIRDHEPERDGEAEDVEQNLGNALPPQRLGHDIEGKKRRTKREIKNHYDRSRKHGKGYLRNRPRPPLLIESALHRDIQTEATKCCLKSCKILDKIIMQKYLHFSEDALWMRNYFREEQRRTQLPPFQQFNIYKEYFAKETKTSTSVATCELRTHLSNSVGFISWNSNGNTGSATCFVFNHGYIFTCRHVVLMIVGEGTNPHLWPDIISKCATVTFTYKTFRPPAEEWFSIEPWCEVSDGALDYAILKLRNNGNGFPPGLFRHVSTLPTRGVLCLIGHPDGQVKEIDECVVISLKERLERYAEHQQPVVFEQNAATYETVSLFTPRSFSQEAWSTDTLTYDTCFSSGASGSPVFDASGSVVAMHSFGHFYIRGRKQYAIIEFGYSMDLILFDLKQKDGALYQLLSEEKKETIIQEKNNKQDSLLQHSQMEPMEH
ncbi:serine protease FAM111B-like [Saccopteryx bilineata]|uniref:serine protease FAM111B-like n=1 Tax=Saccopteryx bilineata TaxID=59482 RepID=UPI00338F9964